MQKHLLKIRKVFTSIACSPLILISNSSELAAKYMPNENERLRNTLEINNQEIKFIITDFKNEISVSFKGTIPNLFAEGKGVVAEGMLKDKRFFEADRILAKHDENYMPPELKNILSDNAK